MSFPGEKLVIRLLETIEKSSSWIVRPSQIRREGKAETDVLTDRKRALVQAEQDCEDIRTGRKRLTPDHKLITADKNSVANTFSQAVQRRMVYREMKTEINTEKAVLAASKVLQDDPEEPPEKHVNEDWLLRWRGVAGQVSLEELQDLWGRVLAGEIKSPGTFSLRTLEFLKNLSKEETDQIAKLAPFVINGDFVYGGNESLLESQGITFGLLLNLHDLGILHSSNMLQRKITSNNQDKFTHNFLSYNRVLVISHDDPKKALTLKCHRLTTLGIEVMKIGIFETNEAYIRNLGEIIRDREFKVELADYRRITEIKGRYFNPVIL